MHVPVPLGPPCPTNTCVPGVEPGMMTCHAWASSLVHPSESSSASWRKRHSGLLHGTYLKCGREGGRGISCRRGQFNEEKEGRKGGREGERGRKRKEGRKGGREKGKDVPQESVAVFCRPEGGPDGSAAAVGRCEGGREDEVIERLNTGACVFFVGECDVCTTPCCCCS